MTSSIDIFRRHVTALGGIYYRIDSGYMNGRNSNATDDAMAYHFRKARETLSAACKDDSDPLPEYLDTPRGARLAAKWAALEYRYLGVRA